MLRFLVFSGSLQTKESAAIRKERIRYVPFSDLILDRCWRRQVKAYSPNARFLFGVKMSVFMKSWAIYTGRASSGRTPLPLSNLSITTAFETILRITELFHLRIPLLIQKPKSVSRSTLLYLKMLFMEVWAGTGIAKSHGLSVVEGSGVWLQKTVAHSSLPSVGYPEHICSVTTNR